MNLIKLLFSQEAKEFIYEQSVYRKNKGLNKLVVVLFYHSGESWTMSFCGNFVEMVEKHKVEKDSDFILWSDTNLDELKFKESEIEVYIENSIISELEEKSMVIIDAAKGEVKNRTVGVLFIKKESNVYG